MAETGAAAFAGRFPGLTSAEAAERGEAAGTNRFESQATRSYLRIFIDNAFPAANVALITVATALLALGRPIDALFTGGLVAGNIVVGVFQESRAKRQLERIAVLARADATVIRDGRAQQIDAGDIVQGDIVIVGPGDQVQADGTVLEDDRCSVDESLLTGESDLVRKRDGDSLYSGSFCMSGRAVYRCERVGSDGFANQIAARARAFRVVRTPLQREIGYVMWGMAAMVTLLAIAVAWSFHEIYGRVPVVETTRAAAVVVTLVPQGLWVMVTVTYAIAIVRMSPLGTLVQRLNAIESMSHVDVLCLDKTGTITTNALRLEALHPLGADEAELRRLLARYAASASISNRTNDAISEAMGGEPAPVADEVHFDSARKWSALVFEGDDPGVYVLGAPEAVAPDAAEDAEPLRSAWLARGLRVLMFARNGEARAITRDGEQPRLPHPLTALGYVVLRDELRPGARATIERFADTGIALKIISGDNPETVAALARAAGVDAGAAVISGADLREADDERMDEIAGRTTIFGRIVPEQKARIVAALQRRGHYVAMIGDGVNDVPALKRAQVAISMRAGSPVTRSIADLILLDDSFINLPAAFSEGQRIRRGMEAMIRLFLVRTISVAVVILGAALVASKFPYTPRQTGILSTVTVGIPVLLLAAWAQPGQTGRYLVPRAARFVAPAALLLGLMGLAVYEIGLARNDGAGVARTMLTAASALAGIALIPFVDEPPWRWFRVRALLRPARLAALAVAMVALFALSMGVDAFRRFYELDRLGAMEWLIVAVGVLAWAAALALTWRAVDAALAGMRRSGGAPGAT